MMKHIVFLQFKSDTPKTQIEHAFALLDGLRQPIPQIKSFKFGKYDSKEGMNHGFDYGFEMEFDNAEDRDIYLYHPTHLEVANQIIPLLEKGTDSLIAFDYDPSKGL
ncbi:hypothetical protein GCM10023211_14200 [Orbus sasakiae]|uniref:Stress-response A/B barrel domain-containing protein n=1 Tax=Orbus sasakiae TaxID=1078475 RepID=A0ABP9N7R2_9GAMM